MRGRFFLWMPAVALVAGSGACGSVHRVASAPPEPPADRTSSLSMAERDSARKIYVAKCARCHKFHDPAKYPDNEWRVWLDKMSRKAKLKPDQKELLRRYLDRYRVGGETNSGSS